MKLNFSGYGNPSIYLLTGKRLFPETEVIRLFGTSLYVLVINPSKQDDTRLFLHILDESSLN